MNDSDDDDGYHPRLDDTGIFKDVIGLPDFIYAVAIHPSLPTISW